MARAALTLDLATPGVPELLADFRALVLLEALRGVPSHATIGDIAAAAEVSQGVAQSCVDRLVTFGLVESRRVGRQRSMAYRALHGPLVVTFDPADPKTASRVAAARMALLAHLRHLGTARASRAARKGSAWRRDVVAVLPLEGRSRDVVRTCLDRVDACLEAASKAAAETTTEAPDRRPRFRVQVAVEPVESRSLALPVVLLMERGDAALRTVQKPRTDSLSVRERQVAVELASGRTKREVASALGLSFATVNTLAVRAYRKLGVTRRAQLVNALAGLR